MGKADSTGTFSFLCDGASPASPVLWDGYAVYTPGLSENRGGTTLYNHADLLGSLVELTDSQQQPTNAAEYDGFGSITSSWLGQGQVPSVTPFKFGGANGCQTDADTGLVLMGHRYYDKRTGRFISQDPAGDGDNWYGYAGNDPMNGSDPSGLSQGLPWESGAPDQRYGGLGGGLGDDPGGLFGGTSGLDGFFASEDAAMEQGRQEYIQSEIAKSLQKLLFDETAAKGFFHITDLHQRK